MPNSLSAREAARRIREGLLTSRQLVEACLRRISETDPVIRAWAFVDGEGALAQADICDDLRRRGMPIGPLHGVPVGLKDIIDVRGMPCERGTPLFAGRVAEEDAFIVTRLREAGAIILGKTVTTELAFMNPSVTRNPHNPEHTPGGSSSGSAAAVAGFHVPITVGTQTNGSVIRPASFCGTFGFKPTRGVLARTGLLETSGSLDQIGVFARDLDDVALLSDAMACHDPADPLSYQRARPQMLDGAMSPAPVEPAFAALDLPYDDRLQADAREGMNELVEFLGAQVDRLPAPPAFSNLVSVQRTIHLYEYNRLLGDSCRADWDKVSDVLKPLVEEAAAIGASQYEDALSIKHDAERYFSTFFADYDAILTHSAAGEAPLFNTGTGDPVFCTIWTLAGLPAVSLPILTGNTGLPVGVQLVGPIERDDRLLRTAGWLLEQLKRDTIPA
ncbi:MAG: amidase [Rhizobiaceae bacterium]